VLLGVAFLILWLTEVFVFSKCQAKVENRQDICVHKLSKPSLTKMFPMGYIKA
jgi:VanZ family protein